MGLFLLIGLAHSVAAAVCLFKSTAYSGGEAIAYGVGGAGLAIAAGLCYLAASRQSGPRHIS
jgi:hypothetical protein